MNQKEGLDGIIQIVSGSYKRGRKEEREHIFNFIRQCAKDWSNDDQVLKVWACEYILEKCK